MTDEIDLEALKECLAEPRDDPRSSITALESIIDGEAKFYDMTPEKFAVMRAEAQELMDQFCRQGVSPELKFAVDAFYIRWEFHCLDANLQPVLVLKPNRSN